MPLQVGNIYITGSVQPSTDGTTDLGHASFKFNDLHIMSSSIFMYDESGPIGKLSFRRGGGFRIRKLSGDPETPSDDGAGPISGSDLYVGGDAKILGTLTAQEFKTEFVSSSIIFESGSTLFGDDSADIHQFVGKLGINDATPGAVLHVTGSVAQGIPVFKVEGTSGSLFEVSDSYEGTLFSINDKEGKPIIDAKADGTVSFSSTSGSQMEAIASPEVGSIVWQSETGSLYVYNGTAWRSLFYSSQVGSPLTIFNADVNSSAAIATSKLSGAVTSIASHGLATSATTDTTNASNISSGTLAAARVATLNQNTTGNAATATTAGTVTTAAQSAITSVGTLTGLTITGNAYYAGGSTSRIYFNNRRAIEGTTDGSILQLGEDFTKIRIRGGQENYGDNLYLNFGIAGNGANVNGRWLSIEGNCDTNGEGSSRIFFAEHNSTTAGKSKYGMSIGYRGGDTSIIGGDGNTWTGLSQISNGSWGMWGHDDNATGSLIMYGSRNASNLYIVPSTTFAGNVKATTFTVGLSSSLGIAGSYADSNNMELGPGYIVLTRDDTASAKQIQLWKNGSIHTYFETTTSGLVFSAAGGLKPASNFDPADNNSYTLGTTSKRWSSVAAVTGDFSGNATFSGNISTTGGNIDIGAANLNGIRFWNGSSLYRISMSSIGTSGAGRMAYESSSDYNMYFKMSGGTDRGFVFQNGTSNIFGVDGAGHVRANSVISSNNRQAIACTHWSNSGTSTGAIKITLPGTPGNVHSMPIIEVHTYQYNSIGHVIYRISGHNYATVSNWYNNRVTAEGGPPLSVRLGHDGSNYCIIIGDTNTGWSYGHVTVNLLAHPSFYNANQNFTEGWGASQITSLPSNVTAQTVGKIFHSANDGSDSGLDADLLDGIQGASFLRSDADDTVSKQLTFSSTVGERPILQGGFLSRLSSDGDADIWGISEDYYPSHATAGNAWGIQWKSAPNSVNFVGNGQNRLVIDLDGGSAGLTWEGNTVLHADNYSSYALPLSGGDLTGHVNLGVNYGVTGTSTPTYSQAMLELQTSSNYVPAIGFHRGSYSATTLYEYDGRLFVNAWTTRAQTGELLTTGNYSSYANFGSTALTAGTATFASLNVDGAVDFDLGGTSNLNFGADTNGVHMHVGSNQFFRIIGDAGSDEWMRIIDGGNVGIGNSSPQFSLDIGDDAHSSGKKVGISAESNGGSAIVNDMAALILGPKGNRTNTANNYHGGGIAFNHLMRWSNDFDSGWNNHMHAYIGLRMKDTTGAEASHLIFATNNSDTQNASPTERMCIESDGNVGIGKVSPTGTLHVYGAGHPSSKPVFKAEGSSGSLMELHDTFEGTLYSANDKEGRPVLKAMADGYVNMRHVSASQMEAIPSPELGALLFNSTSGSYSVFDGTNWRNIANTSAGDVGIGLAAPVAKLHVRGGSSSHIVEFDSVGGEDRFQFGGVSDSDNAYLSMYNSAAAQKVKFHTNAASYITGGNVGIGTTSPGQKLTISSGNVYIDNSKGYMMGGTDNYISVESTRMAFTQNGSEALSILDGGNVGIGTTSPSAWFEISADNTDELLNIYSTTYTKNILNMGGAGFITFEGGGTSSTPDFKIIDPDNTAGRGALQIQGNGGSTEIAFFDSTGKVGIGTTSPGTKLHVYGDNGDEVARFASDGATDSPYISFFQTTTRRSFIQHLDSGDVLRVASEYGDIRFDTGTGGSELERMRITSGGNVGIGTTGPGAKLQVKSAITSGQAVARFLGTGTGDYLRGIQLFNSGLAATNELVMQIGKDDTARDTGQVYFHYAGDASTSNYLSLGLHSVDNLLNIVGTGRVGIGTTSPSAKLEVVGDIKSSTALISDNPHGSTYASFSHKDQATAGGYAVLQHSGGTIYLNRPSGQNMHFRENNSDQMFIKSGGNVGIGTTAPATKLHVQGSNVEEEVARFSVWGQGGSNQGIVYIGLDRHGGGTYPGVRIGAEEIDAADYRHNLFFQTNSATSDSAPTTKMFIRHDGNVGIGTTNPGYKLDVGGTLGVTGNTTINGDVTIQGTGDRTLWLRADSDNYTETDHPLLKMTQDGEAVGWHLGFVNNTNYAEMAFTATGTDYLYLKFVNTNRFRFSDTGQFDADGDVVSYSSAVSDVRLKDNITPITNALEIVNQIDTIKYQYKNKRDGYHYGIKAQQLEELIPEIVKEIDLSFHTRSKDKDNKLIVRDKELIPFLIEAIKEQQIQIEALEAKIGEA